jgi:hypothetical protein
MSYSYSSWLYTSKLSQKLRIKKSRRRITDHKQELRVHGKMLLATTDYTKPVTNFGGPVTNRKLLKPPERQAAGIEFAHFSKFW